MDKGYGTDMTYELRQCQVRIDCDVATVLMVSTIEDGKIVSMKMKIDEFLLHENIRRNKIQQGE